MELTNHDMRPSYLFNFQTLTRAFLLIAAMTLYTAGYGQTDDRISTMDFVQILNGNKEEASFYYQNNWKVLREQALKRQYIDSFDILETSASEGEPFQLVLITTYSNRQQYDKREDHFSELIREQEGLKLLNDKKPPEFRKTLFSKEMVRHWN